MNLKLSSIWYEIIDPVTQVPEIEISFDDNDAQKLILYHYNAMPNSKAIDSSRLCNYIGYLEGDKDSRVSVSGCLSEKGVNEKAFITLFSKDSLYQKSFSLDRYGNFKQIKSDNYEINASKEDRDVHVDDWHTFGNQKMWDKKEQEAESVTQEQRDSVPYSLNLNFRFGYDKGTKQWMEENNENVDNWLSEVMTHLQIHFTHSSLEHYIFLNVSLKHDFSKPLLYLLIINMISFL